jgi:hypothetical protein
MTLPLNKRHPTKARQGQPREGGYHVFLYRNTLHLPPEISPCGAWKETPSQRTGRIESAVQGLK